MIRRGMLQAARMGGQRAALGVYDRALKLDWAKLAIHLARVRELQLA